MDIDLFNMEVRKMGRRRGRPLDDAQLTTPISICDYI